MIDQNAEGVTVAASAVTSSINYQGRLADSAGEPLSGTYDMTFRLYEVVSGGTALDTDTHSVDVTEGLLNTDIDFDQDYFDGRELWLGITVGIDPEMSPRQELMPVPYALSLKPGAVINGAVSGPVLEVNKIGNGVWVKTTGNRSEGVWIETTGNNCRGFSASIYGDQSEGVYVGTTGYNSDGVKVKTTGYGSDGIYPITYGDYSHGVCAFTCGNTSPGVYASTTGIDSDGFRAFTTGNNSEGVYASSDKSYAIYAQTNRLDNKYGVFTPDYMYALKYEGGGSDIAEYFHVTEDAEPGTVMVIGEDSKLQSSVIAYDTTVAGIVSTAPGVSLGTNETGNVREELIAVAGRVPCKVDSTYASVKPGDLLTTSDTSGHAMKATNPQIGTILGKALEPLDSGTGVIEVLVTLQ